MSRKLRELDDTNRLVRDRVKGGAKTTAVKRLVVLVAALVLALPLVLLAVIPAPAGARDTVPTAADTALRLPDLRMGPIQDLRIRKTPDGRRLLRFSTMMVNVGAGPFELQGERPDTNTPEMTVTQHIYQKNARRYRELSTTARIFYSGDGHDHWHVKDLQRFTLKRLGNSRQVHEGAKNGFCVWDFTFYNLTLPGAPSSKVYREANTCGDGREDALEVDMGLSVGWADKYSYFLPYQWIDITGLRSGTYRIRAVVDGKGQFKESGEANNRTWVNVELKGNKVNVLKEGPFPRYCGRGRFC